MRLESSLASGGLAPRCRATRGLVTCAMKCSRRLSEAEDEPPGYDEEAVHTHYVYVPMCSIDTQSICISISES